MDSKVKEFFHESRYQLIRLPGQRHSSSEDALQQALGVEPYVDSAYYVGFRVGDQEIGLDPNGHNKGMTGPIGYCQVDDIQKSLQVLLDAGAQTQQEVTNVGGGLLIAWVKDADNNLIGLRQFL